MIMVRDFFMATYPPTKLSTEESVGVSVFINIQLLDYFLHNSPIESEWIKDFSHKLPDRVKDDLRLLRTVFAHGVILRDFYFKQMDHHHEDWEAFINWWKELDEEEVLELIIYGIQEVLDYYYQYLPTIPAVETIMDGVSLDTGDLKKNNHNRENGIKAVLASWSVEEMDEILPLYRDWKGVKERIVRLLSGFWEAGFEAYWEGVKSSISEWKLKNTEQMSKSFGTNEEAIFTITGLYPDTSDIEEINRVHFLTFIPVPNMGRLLSFAEIIKHGFLMFDPFLNNSGKIESPINSMEFRLAFEGLGDATRLQIIQLLATHKEMFAQQIVTKLNMKQSTVSRHLNQLHQSKLVAIRQDGNTKYYSIHKEEIRKVIEVLETLLT